MNEAAKNLFISQPRLSNAIKELEKEIKTTIFIRTNRGVTITNEGSEFLGYARQVLQQFNMLEEKYLSEEPAKQHFRSEEHTSELQSRGHLVCRLLLEKKKKQNYFVVTNMYHVYTLVV